MRANLTAASLMWGSVLSFTVLLSGCYSTSERESGGAKLSEVMKGSVQGDKPDPGVHHSGESSSGEVDVFTMDSADVAGMFGASFDEVDYHWQILADVRYTIPFRGDIKSLTHLTLTPICLEDEKNFLGLYLGAAIVEFDRGSLPDIALRDQWMGEVGLNYRRYFNSSRKALSPYVGASLGYQLLAWNYRSPAIPRGGRIPLDTLSGGQGTIVLGVSSRRDKRLSVFGEIGLGGTYFLDKTSEGFKNDVFDSYGFFSVKAGLSLKL